MKSQNYFQKSISILLLCTITSLLIGNGRVISSVVESGLTKFLSKTGGGGSEQFKCGNGRNIPSVFKCDGDNDCEDGSDEQSCPIRHCNEDQFRCESGKCVLQSDRCDGEIDCLDKTDEASCKNCSSAAFTCGSGECVPNISLCNARRDCNDGSDEICPEGLTPSSWHEHWHPGNGNQLLTRVFAKDNVAVYFDPKMNKKVNWFFEPLSEAWKYIQSTYGQIGTTNPNLYVTLHQGKLGCVTASFFERPSGYRTLLDCGQLGNKWADNSPAVFETLFSGLGSIIREGANSILNDADIKICEEQIKHILFYDIYLHLKGKSSGEALAWESRIQTEYVTVEGSKRHCFRDWFLPIYKQHGKDGVLNNYLQNTKTYWQQHPIVGYTPLNLGQWVHFWSGSAGADLQPLALKAFTWTAENQEELNEARITYPTLHYKVNKYILAYDDNEVAFKFQNYRKVSNSVYETLSNAWSYVKSAYNPHNVNPKLEVHLEDRDDRFGTTGCQVISQNTKLTPSLGDSTDKIDYQMKCGKSVFQKWEATSTSSILDDILTQMAKLTLSHILVSQDAPKNDNTDNNRQFDKSVIFDLELQPIIVYDIYMELGRTDDAEQWKMEQSRKRSNFPEKSTHLFRDWYLEIYKTYDGTNRKIVKDFVQLVNERFHSTLSLNNKKTRQMNVGEFVHFWSGALEENQMDLAGKCFKWNNQSIKQFYEARKNFPELNYDCDACKNNPTTDTKPNSVSPKGDYTIAIVVGVSATILVAAFICFGIKFVTDRRRIAHLSLQIRNLTPKELDEFHLGNPNLSSSQAHAPIHSLPFKNEFEIPRERLIIDEKRVLGSGAFGVVKRGLLLGDEFLGTSDTVVAVKAVKRRVDIAYFKAQLLEIKIMAYLGRHENIASLLATVTTNIVKCEVLFALEFCAKGDLYQYLNKHRRNFTDLWNNFKQKNLPSTSSSGISCGSISDSNSEISITQSTSRSSSSRFGHVVKYKKMSEPLVSISTLDLLTWSRQIACGMEYLGLKEVIHGDLAARNVLLTDKSVVKISDFGLSRQLVNYSHYHKTSTTPVPWRWLAIESLTQMIFSLNSDVWSFGVTLWEIFTLGNLPYVGKHWDQEFVSELSAGLRLDTPDFGNQEIYNLMLNCMKKEPAARMPFSQIGTQLDRIKTNLVQLPAESIRPSTSSSRGSSRGVHYEPFKQFKVV